MNASITIEDIIGDLNFDPEELKAKYLLERDKRIRSDTAEQYVEMKAEFSEFSNDPNIEAPIKREPLTDEVEVAIIGGGFGSLLTAARLREAGFDDLRIIEKAGDFGGTWYWNRYPGAMCDIESYCYLPLLEETGYIPERKYSFGPEIFAHAKRIARHYNLYDNVCFQTGVTELRWSEDISRWIISTDRGDKMQAQYVTMALGPLDKPKLPGIPGISDFKGHTFHTSRWDYAYTGGDHHGKLTGLKDKRIGIIGTGATSIQCIPALGESAKSLHIFQRTPSAVDVRNNFVTDPEWAKTLEPGWQQNRMDNFIGLLSGLELDEDLVDDGWTDMVRNVTAIAAQNASKTLGRELTQLERNQLLEHSDYKKMNQIRNRAAQIVKDPKTAESLQAWYRQLCKRPCFHDEYLQAFNLPNVTLVDTDGKGVTRFTESGVVVEGVEYELDCLIFATGFEVGTAYSQRAGYEIIGLDGKSLTDHWQNGVRSFHGMQANGFPNCFFIGSPQAAITINATHSFNEQAKTVAYIMSNVKSSGMQVVEATQEAEQAYVDEVHSLAGFHSRFYSECTPGYYNSEGQAGNSKGIFTAMYGGSSVDFFVKLAKWKATGKLEGLDLR